MPVCNAWHLSGWDLTSTFKNGWERETGKNLGLEHIAQYYSQKNPTPHPHIGLWMHCFLCTLLLRNICFNLAYFDDSAQLTLILWKLKVNLFKQGRQIRRQSFCSHLNCCDNENDSHIRLWPSSRQRHWPQFKAGVHAAWVEIEGKAYEEEFNQLSTPVHHHNRRSYKCTFVCLFVSMHFMSRTVTTFFCTGFNFFFIQHCFLFVLQFFVTD